MTMMLIERTKIRSAHSAARVRVLSRAGGTGRAVLATSWPGSRNSMSSAPAAAAV